MKIIIKNVALSDFLLKKNHTGIVKSIELLFNINILEKMLFFTEKLIYLIFILHSS